MFHRLPVMFAALAALAGCATMSEDECASADWRAVGVRDGSRGETLVMGERRASACARHGFAMHWEDYEAGRQEGLAVYCVPANGFALGDAGRSYDGVCRGHDEAAFLAAWEEGHTRHAFRSAIDGASRALAQARARHDEIDLQFERYEDGHRDEELSMEEHNTLVLNLWSERKYLRTEAIPYWQYAQRFLTEQFDAWQAAGGTGAATPRHFAGPDPWQGPTQAEAREMLAEVFSRLERAVSRAEED